MVNFTPIIWYYWHILLHWTPVTGSCALHSGPYSTSETVTQSNLVFVWLLGVTSCKWKRLESSPCDTGLYINWGMSPGTGRGEGYAGWIFTPTGVSAGWILTLTGVSNFHINDPKRVRERERLSLSAFLRTEDIGVHIVHISRLIITYTLE